MIAEYMLSPEMNCRQRADILLKIAATGFRHHWPELVCREMWEDLLQMMEADTSCDDKNNIIVLRLHDRHKVLAEAVETTFTRLGPDDKRKVDRLISGPDSEVGLTFRTHIGKLELFYRTHGHDKELIIRTRLPVDNHMDVIRALANI